MPWLVPLLAGAAAAAPVAMGALGGGDSADLQTERIGPPGDVEALRRIFSRAIAQNMFNMPPSFQEYVGSGGEARFPIQFTGLSPVEMRQLRFVGPQGEEIPFARTDQESLSPAQLLFLGRHDERQGLNSRPSRLYRSEVRVNQLQRQLDDPAMNRKRRARLENRLARAKANRDDLLSRSTDFGLANIPMDREDQAPGFGSRRKNNRGPTGYRE